jgi:hypothetical protein
MFIIITITYPLFVSATTGHFQVEYVYWLLSKELFFYNGSVDLVLVINCVYIYIYIYIYIYGTSKKTKTPWYESAGELYRPRYPESKLIVNDATGCNPQNYI